eukprot:TRINITY_DN6710_c1_g1_i1.p1 TRINITY_DN6710_c1_g1~~TRINITY_DN6710_c1_g1_i1.p1  ORF type:complete len:467 (+),score=118.70 TRINITY_DN6710_c1_g1_i1:159-1403(+)
MPPPRPPRPPLPPAPLPPPSPPLPPPLPPAPSTGTTETPWWVIAAPCIVFALLGVVGVHSFIQYRLAVRHGPRHGRRGFRKPKIGRDGTYQARPEDEQSEGSAAEEEGKEKKPDASPWWLRPTVELAWPGALLGAAAIAIGASQLNSDSGAVRGISGMMVAVGLLTWISTGIFVHFRMRMEYPRRRESRARRATGRSSTVAPSQAHIETASWSQGTPRSAPASVGSRTPPVHPLAPLPHGSAPELLDEQTAEGRQAGLRAFNADAFSPGLGSGGAAAALAAGGKRKGNAVVSAHRTPHSVPTSEILGPGTTWRTAKGAKVRMKLDRAEFPGGKHTAVVRGDDGTVSLRPRRGKITVVNANTARVTWSNGDVWTRDDAMADGQSPEASPSARRKRPKENRQPALPGAIAGRRYSD